MSKARKQRSLSALALVGVFLVSILAGVSSSFAGPPRSNPGQPFAVILNELESISERLDELEAKIDNQAFDLSGVTQNWDKKLDSTNGDANGCNSDRFTCIWPTDAKPDGAAVRDNETGVVWERHPESQARQFWSANNTCNFKSVAGRFGWRLPTIQELANLLDTSQANPSLPAGHPFANILTRPYWSATQNSQLRYWDTPTTTPDTLVVYFSGSNWGSVSSNWSHVANHYWCVRGATGRVDASPGATDYP